jgi:hypothetical protein
MIEKFRKFEIQDAHSVYGKGVIVTMDDTETDVD